MIRYASENPPSEKSTVSDRIVISVILTNPLRRSHNLGFTAADFLGLLLRRDIVFAGRHRGRDVLGIKYLLTGGRDDVTTSRGGVSFSRGVIS